MSAYCENVGALPKCQRFIKMSGFYKKKVGTLHNMTWKIYNKYTSWPSYCLAWQNPQWLLLCALSVGSCSVLKVLYPPLIVAEYQLLQAGQLIWAHWPCTSPPWSYRPNVGVLLKSRRPIWKSLKMVSLYLCNQMSHRKMIQAKTA
jgi:hypothetical protein